MKNFRSCKSQNQCSVGQYINNTCTGMEEYNTETCANCTSCPYGYYHANHSGYIESLGMLYVEEQQACNGTGILPSDGNTSCQRCDTCPMGQYASNVSRCTGNGIWKDKFTCSNCQICASGFMHQAPCDGTTFNDTCVECPNCTVGFYKASQWNNSTKRMDCSCQVSFSLPLLSAILMSI